MLEPATSFHHPPTRFPVARHRLIDREILWILMEVETSVTDRRKGNQRKSVLTRSEPFAVESKWWDGWYSESLLQPLTFTECPPTSGQCQSGELRNTLTRSNSLRSSDATRIDTCNIDLLLLNSSQNRKFTAWLCGWKLISPLFMA